MAPKSVVENVDNNKKEICNIERTFFPFFIYLAEKQLEDCN